jgi:hypothetical protein
MNDSTSPRFAAKPTRTSMPDWYRELLDSVATHITTGHRRAVSAANAELLATNVRTAMPDEGPDLAQQATRDPYLFDFIEATEKEVVSVLPSVAELEAELAAGPEEL